MTFDGESLPVQEFTVEACRGLDIALFSVSTELAREYAPQVAANGTLVIDDSAAFRMDPDVPLVVPEVNPDAARAHNGIIAGPNCSTAQMVVALQPLHKAATLKRVDRGHLPGSLRRGQSGDGRTTRSQPARPGLASGRPRSTIRSRCRSTYSPRSTASATTATPRKSGRCRPSRERS